MQSLWQSADWEKFQKALGHKCIRVKAGEKALLAMIYPLFASFNYAYLPRIPKLIQEEWDSLEESLQKIQKKHRLIFTRFDSTQDQEQQLKKLTLKKSHSSQPETTLLLDLRLSEKELLSQMKRKGRYNIGLAKKKEVEVTEAKSRNEKEEYISRFYTLLRETTERDHFSGHKENYYQKLIQNVKGSSVLLASKNGKDLAGLISVKHGETMIYYYGASANTHRELMAPYLLQWETFLKGKKEGCKIYDFLGIAPEGADDSHPWKGITSFKKKFGGQVRHFGPAYDIIHSSGLYFVFKILKSIQKIFR